MMKGKKKKKRDVKCFGRLRGKREGNINMNIIYTTLCYYCYGSSVSIIVTEEDERDEKDADEEAVGGIASLC